MAEKCDKKLSKASLTVEDSSRPEKIESPLDYLYRSGVGNQVKEVISLLISNRPDDPLVFLAEFFSTKAESSSSISKAQQKILLAHHSKAVFWENMMDSYQDLSKEKALNGVKGLLGKVYNELLLSLCSDMNVHDCESLSKRLVCRDDEVIPCSVYKQGVVTCIIFKDFLKQAENLYSELDMSGRGLADKELCKVCLGHLKTVIAFPSPSEPVKILHLRNHLSASNLNSTMYEALMSGPQTKRETMSSEEFLSEAVAIFLEQIPTVR